MEHLTPAELLRFLEAEANTLQFMNAKIANQVHHLQVEEELFSRQLSNLEKDQTRPSVLLIESAEAETDVNGNRDHEDNLQNEIHSEEFEQRSTALAGQALGSRPKLLESPGGRKSSETIETESDHHVEKNFQGQQQEQEVVTVEEPSPSLRMSGRRISRRPARFQD